MLADTEIASVALYTAHATPLELPVELLGDQPTSGPGSVLATATLRVETRPGWYQANFDPQFFAPFYIEIQKAFKVKFGRDFQPAKKTFIQKLFGASV